MRDNQRRPGPDDPFPSVLQQGLVAAHEMFVQLREAGFTVREAAAVIAAILIASGGEPAPEE